jgi:hypothetical protein
VGQAGERPTLVASAQAPFSRQVDVAGVSVVVRMESWLAFDTIRRMGFGHVIVARRHTLIVERGVSFAAFDAQGKQERSSYAATIFEPRPRYEIARNSAIVER